METYELRIDFVRDSKNPSRVFRSMAGLLDTVDRMDRTFLAELAFPVTTQSLLHDVSSGSIKAIIKWILELPDKEALREGDWKKVLGRMLDDSREYFLHKIDDQPKIESSEQLIEMQRGLGDIAERVPHGLIHVIRPIPLTQLFTIIQSLETSTRVLIDGDEAELRRNQRVTRIATGIEISPDLEDELLEAIPAQHPTRSLLPVKKPDLIGDSQWDLYFGGKVIRAKIFDTRWLEMFHSRAIELKPGDALDAEMEVTLLYSHDNQLVGYRYKILQVYGVIPAEKWRQLELPNDDQDGA